MLLNEHSTGAVAGQNHDSCGEEEGLVFGRNQVFSLA